MFSCRRLTSLQQTRLVSRDADRSRRSRYAPVYGMYYTTSGVRSNAVLAAQAFLHGALHLAFGGLLGDLAPLVVLLLTAGDGQLELYVVVFSVEPQGDERLAFFLALADEPGYLPFVQEELTVAGRELLAVGGVRVWGDVGADEKDLAVPGALCAPSASARAVLLRRVLVAVRFVSALSATGYLMMTQVVNNVKS